MGTLRGACAACSYRRRRCDPDCIFACYFNDHRTFANIDRLFGRVKAETMIRVSNDSLRTILTILYILFYFCAL